MDANEIRIGTRLTLTTQNNAFRCQERNIPVTRAREVYRLIRECSGTNPKAFDALCGRLVAETRGRTLNRFSDAHIWLAAAKTLHRLDLRDLTTYTTT